MVPSNRVPMIGVTLIVATQIFIPLLGHHLEGASQLPDRYISESPSSAVMSMQVTFPQEIFDAIIDHLHDDLDALRQCSFVCKSWLPSASLHLFSSLTCPPPDDPDLGYLGYVVDDGCYGIWSSRLSSVTRILPYVRKLTLGNLTEGDPNIETINIPVLLHILDHLPSLNTLHFAECVPKHGTSVVGLPGTRALREIELTFTIDSDPGNLQGALEFFGSFKRISSIFIELLEIESESWKQCIVPRVNSLVEVDDLHLAIRDDEATYPFVFHCLGRVLDFQKLRALTFPLTETTVPAGLALDVVPNISELTYSVNTATSPLGLSNLHLSSFHIAGRFYITNDHKYFSSWQFITRDLQLLHCASLRRITVNIRATNTHVCTLLPPYATKALEHISPPSWEPIAHVLQRCSLLELFCIEIRHYMAGDAEDESRWIAHFYSGLREVLPAKFVDEKVQVTAKRF